MLNSEINILQEILILFNSIHFLGNDVETIYYINKKLNKLLSSLIDIKNGIENPKIIINNEDKKE